MLVVTTAPVDQSLLRERVRSHTGDAAEVRVVAPASDVSPLQWLASDEDEARGEAAFTEKQPSGNEALEARIAELERFCGQLSLENQILKKSLKSMHSSRGMP